MTKNVGVILSTEDYGMFKKLKGNREIMDFRKTRIIESIKERGWIRNPIVVNEKMEVIDGQGRLEALQELGMPVEFIIAVGASIDDCIALNLKQSNWRMIDFVKCYADMGKSSYQLLLSLYGKYEFLTETCVNTLCGKANCDGAVSSKEIKSGNFKIFDEKNLDALLEFANECMSFINQGSGRSRIWCAVFKFVFYCDKIPNDVFLERLKKNRVFLMPTNTIKQTLECVEKVYNYGAKKNRCYFIPEWDSYLQTRKGE